MTITRKASVEILAHLVSMLDSPKDTRFARTLEYAGVIDLEDLSALSKDDIESFVTPPSTEASSQVTTALPRGYKNKLFLMVRWLHQLRLDNAAAPLTETGYQTLSRADFDNYRLDVDNTK